MRRFAAILMILSLTVAVWAKTASFSITWSCDYSGDDYISFRYQLDGEDPSCWTVIPSTTQSFVTYTESLCDHVLHIQKTTDGINWSDSMMISASSSFLSEECEEEHSAIDDGFSISASVYGGLSQQNIFFDDGTLQSSRGMGGKALVCFNLNSFLGLDVQSNYQVINYMGFDYEELSALGKARFRSCSDRVMAFFDLGGGINIVNIANTTCLYSMVSADAGIDVMLFDHVSVSMMGEYSVSFQPGSVNNHFAVFVGLSASFDVLGRSSGR